MLGPKVKQKAVEVSLIALFALSAPLAQNLKPEDTVATQVLLSNEKLKPGAEFRGAVVLDVRDGFHINSSAPSDPALIPTKVEVSSGAGISVSRYVYPRAVSRTFQFSEKPLEVYEGKVLVGFLGKVDRAVKLGKQELQVKVRFQACNDDTCFRPVTAMAKVPVEIAAVMGRSTNRGVLSSVIWQ